MKFWIWIVQQWVNHGTKWLGAAQGTVATLAGITDLIPIHQLKYWLATSGLLTFYRGLFNTAQSKKDE